ncbi:carbohydrate ABC transporter substrate-binding protein [Nonomuraea mesophila]|uniref:Carbohydrate ABC transporter substrate-binding protein n=1 Tax=Nonomuraea mesophila TaxID=2530382 RepID=A0A4R5E6H2_9ACTN|nr:carbohydrate ABC transporter substrate-binding protein [Nonomuraea mesophila]TDE26405.1 carbohydrate ABC transporter substrate-binding protein [Nonomuraea mesophila]
MRGLTWDHPRGYAPLDELTRLDLAGPNPYGAVPEPIVWDRQPLEGFESEPIARLCETYDVLVVDHPGLGAAVESLVPMEELFEADELSALRAGSAGRSFDSYHLDGRQWALPLDAATQVAAARQGVRVPAGWTEMAAFARDVRMVLCLGGPHAFLMFCALCSGDFLDEEEEGVRALELMAELLAGADPDLSTRNPIGVLDALAAGEADCCPLLYGYATYPLTFSDAPAWPGRPPGSVLGGTGLAVSRARIGTVREAVRAHLRRLLSEPVQTGLFPATGGQPAARAVWETGGFYRGTRATLEAAWVRPRFPGYIALQERSSALIRDGLLARVPARDLLKDLHHEWRHR